ncbi:uncharacterized protein LOC108665969 [Hyalella azteca]|uniref:Uncharacterized protein LOC108665969 n=1 Tax=Hyalella azteca TaxID=294128 RepID=A0A8B7N4S2_HYAAZ|nr:uncharacterized protein LOC108665969 [Hyalella azteca]
MPYYEDINTITHCLHWDLFENTRNLGKFLPSMTLRKRHGIHSQILWFSPTKSMDVQNRYGNVSFTIPMYDIVSRFGENFYEVDEMSFSDRRCVRVLLAKTAPLTRSRIDTSSSDASIYKMSYWSYAFKKESCGVPNELEIAIEVDDADCRWLYTRCKMEPNNHSLANTQGFGRHTNVCQRHNHFSRNCPYALSLWETKMKLESK